MFDFPVTCRPVFVGGSHGFLELIIVFDEKVTDFDLFDISHEVNLSILAGMFATNARYCVQWSGICHEENRQMTN
jgi:hypothetical protein